MIVGYVMPVRNAMNRLLAVAVSELYSLLDLKDLARLGGLLGLRGLEGLSCFGGLRYLICLREMERFAVGFLGGLRCLAKTEM